MGREWRAKSRERFEDPLGIVVTRANEHIHVVGAARIAVQSERPAADQDELDAAVGERDEQVTKVFNQRQVMIAQV